jgi:cardiolipin synthase
MGSFLDPMADKVLIATLFITLTYMDLIPGRLLIHNFTLLCIAGTIISALLFAAVYLTGGIITRDLLLVAAAFCVRYKSLPPPVSTHYSNKCCLCQKRIQIYLMLPYSRER